MKTIIYIIIGISIISCNNRLDPLEKANRTPVFTINGQDNSWSSDNEDYFSLLEDSVKIFRKYKINYKIEEEEQVSIFLKKDGYKGRSTYLGEKISDSTEVLVGEGKIEYTPYQVGLNSFNYTITDPYDNEATVKINLTCFDNLYPVSDFNIEYLGIKSNYEYTIDARSSYDADAKFGGGLLRYRLMVDLDTMYTPSGVFNYVFPSSGSYTIAIQTMDNDSVWGLKKEINYPVQ